MNQPSIDPAGTPAAEAAPATATELPKASATQRKAPREAVSAKAKAKPSPTAKPAASAKPVSARQPALAKNSNKPAKPVKAGKPVTLQAPVLPPKARLVRDSFTIPELEYAQLDALKRRALGLAHHAKKSELLRAGIASLAAMGDEDLLAVLKAVPPLKTGRPKARKADKADKVHDEAKAKAVKSGARKA